MLRFKKNNGITFPDWILEEFRNICTTYSGGTPTSSNIKYYNGNIPFIRSGEIHQDKTELMITAEGLNNSSAKMVSTGDILYAMYGATSGEVDISKIDGAINQAILCIKPKNEFVSKYIVELLRFYKQKILCTFLQGGQGNLSAETIKSLKYHYPCKEEQQKIADCLSSVDELIADYEAQVENMQSQKKGVMQKIFSQEVRFKADDGSEFPEWEEKAFDEIYDFLKNNTFSRDCLNYEDGEAKNIHYGDVLIKYGAVVNVEDENVPFVNNDIDISKYGDGALLKDGDIIIADTAEDSSVGKATEIQNIQGRIVLSGLHTIPCRPRQEFSPRFLGYYMNSEQYQKQTWPLIQGIKVSSISRGAISKTIITYPCLEEQQKIADCLTAFDNAIEDLQKTVELWKNIKKGLLQQLFDWEGVYDG